MGIGIDTCADIGIGIGNGVGTDFGIGNGVDIVDVLALAFVLLICASLLAWVLASGIGIGN